VVVREGYATVWFLPFFKKFKATHIEEALVLHEAPVPARYDIDSQIAADCCQLDSIPM